MAKVNFKASLQKLLDNELSSSSNDKKQVVSAYKTLIDILKVPQLGKQLHGYHELLFECISQIFLTPLNQFFDDNQLRSLLELASNSCVLSMSQNQIIDGWLQNIEERTFEKPDDDEDDDDDDDLYEDATESEKEEEEEEKIIVIQDNNKRPNRGGGNQRQQNDSLRRDSNSASSTEKNLLLTQPRSNQRNAHVAHSHGHRGGHQNDVSEPSTRGNNNRGARGNRGTNNPYKESDNVKGKGRRAPPFDNKYGVDLSLYDCYICGEYGHVQYDCPKKQVNSKPISRSGARGGGVNNKKQRNRTKSSSSNSSIEPTLNETAQNDIQQVYNHLSKLLNSSLTTDERNKTFDLFLSLIEKLQKQHGENLSKIFLDKETIFYSLFCHVALNDFLFTNDQYSKLYNLKNILLSKKQNLLNEDRSIFSRQRILLPLTIITEHIKTVTQIQQTIFNDFQEYIIRSTSPIPIILYDLIKSILKSNLHIDIKCLENFTKKILFDLKKDIFSNEQFNELESYLSIRTKRFERNNQKQIWKERLNLFKNDHLSVDLNQWISEFGQILKTDDIEQKESSAIVVDHAMWYFAVLLMSSSGHLNKEQYEYLLNLAIESSLFNSIQKFYFQCYLKQGRAPITIKELNEIKIHLESNNNQEKELAYQQIKIILDRPKPRFNNEEIEQPSPDISDLTQINDQSKTSEDIIPIIDNHILLRLISLVEIICSDTNTFSSEQCKELLNKFLYQSTIVRPLSHADQQRLTLYYSRPISLNELKIHCSSIESDLKNFISLLKNRIIMNNDEIFDYLTETIRNIFENRRKFSNEKCQELKSIIERKTFGKKRYQLINEIYQKFRLNQKNPPPINPIILNQLLNNILLHDYQAHLEFFTLLEELCQVIDLNEITIEFEINRCLLSTIILVITEANFSNSTNIDFFRQRLKTIIEKQKNFFSLLLTQQQYELIMLRLTSTSNIDPLINLIKTDFNEKNFINLINFIENELQDKIDFEKIINFILYTFDNEFLTIEQTLKISNLIIQHKKLNNKTFQNLLQFLIDLLQSNIHLSPKSFLNSIENNQDDNQTIEQIIIMLKAKNGKYAVADWKRTMLQLLTILFDREGNHEQLRNIAQQSPMLQMTTFKQQLETYWTKTSDENKQPSAISINNDTNEHSVAHREMFHYLESNDASMNAVVVQQLRAYLLDEQLSAEILLPKFIQALQIIFKDSQKFAEISLDEWATLIEKNRGKIFSNDAQCDQLLMNILFARLNMPNDTLNSLQRLIQSRKAHERHDGLQKLLLLLRNTQINNEKNKINYLPTMSNQLYNIITRVIFDQKFNDNQVRECVTKAKNSSLLNNDQRQKLNL